MKINNSQSGMTYIELIVVLSIFSTLAAIAIYNYGTFQGKVDIKNLANDIALKIVQAQKDSSNGRLPSSGASSSWKPSYGIYFNSSSTLDTDGIAFNKKLKYFVDISQGNDFDSSSCPGPGECLEQMNITKGSYIDKIEKYTGATPTSLTALALTFKRPDPSAIFKSLGVLQTGFDYMQITVKSQNGITAQIKIYPSGRIQIN